ncbi:hypothetical protein GBA52_000257 [Prunus armeniaca]|nr:hypothetical protein GBA52_000257 [Prunus armeniaca]
MTRRFPASSPTESSLPDPPSDSPPLLSSRPVICSPTRSSMTQRIPCSRFSLLPASPSGPSTSRTKPSPDRRRASLRFWTTRSGRTIGGRRVGRTQCCRK